MKHIIYFITSIFMFGCFGKEPLQTALEGKPLPAFHILLPDSVTYIDSKYIPDDKPIALFYFGPNCPHSHAQMKEIINHIHALKTIRFYVITNWPFDKMKAFHEKYELYKYENIITGSDYENFFSRYYDINGVPCMAIYNKTKKLQKLYMGKIESKDIKEATK